jgi:hypothetical protein
MPLPNGNKKGPRELFEVLLFSFANNILPKAIQAIWPERDTQRRIINVKPEFLPLSCTVETELFIAGRKVLRNTTTRVAIN